MFQHTHPYEPFFPAGATKLIVGTLPPPRFTSGKLKEGDVDFCYGSISGLLWPVLDRIFDLDLIFETTQKAIDQRKNFLASRGIGVCDIVHSCEREKIDASDLGMQHIQLRDVVSYLHQYPNIETLLFTGGNSKNGPEYFFRKHLKEYQLKLEVVANDIPRIHSLRLGERTIKTVSLIAPSGAANRSIGSLQTYKDLKNQNPKFNTIDFRVLQYQEYF
ncbi:uracil-DNA glycosylase family protein [uncultured Aquimarina sp.]|uniref:uracil-DNA glycosylase family protein n=1 Tax=uncultured Aquimarina sp. TaxID=575652 RepID=UPI0026028DC8|nr:uracil-DNA glycosylase family protein [uncultured Aquimarina sp.]